jgi:hypothetical protein
MPDGNITQYTQANPGSNLLVLVAPPHLKMGEDNLLTLLAIACAGMSGPDVPSRIGYLTW